MAISIEPRNVKLHIILQPIYSPRFIVVRQYANAIARRILVAMLEYCSVPTHEVLRNHFENYTPFVIRAVTRNILTGDRIKKIVSTDVLVETSIIDNSEEEYKGDIYSSKYFSCSFKSFVEAYTTKCEKSEIKTNDRNIYLAQSTIFECSQTGQNNNYLYELHPYVNKEDFLSLSEVLQINLWMNLNNKSYSALHFDEYHNFLVLHSGTKVVKLISPEYTINLETNPAYTITPHHSRLSWKALSNTTNNNFKVMEVEIHSGDVLFIPEGYWHAVESIPYSIAINYWFKSPLHQFIKGVGTKLDQYLIRYFFQSSIKSQILLLTSEQEEGEKVIFKKRKLDESSLFTDEKEFTNFMEEYYNYVCANNIEQMRRYEKIFVSIDINEQIQRFPKFVATDKIKFLRIMQSVSPLRAHLLTEKWETCDDKSFFAAIFSGNDTIVENFMRKKDALNQSVCDEIIVRLLKGGR